MLCKKPYRPNGPGSEYGCGQCLPCRINKLRTWQARMVLEAMSHDQTCFITLTYADNFLPAGGTLVPDDVKEFRLKLRYRFGPYRYFFVGEYGEISERPHYHAILYGICPTVEQLSILWGKGIVHVGMCTIESVGYCAGYVTKKLTRPDDVRLKGRHREFSRMSTHPGIGATGLDAIMDWLHTEAGAQYILAHHDVPNSVRFNGRIYPLGRYLVSRLREAMGLDTEVAVRRRADIRGLRTLAMAETELMYRREFSRVNHSRRAESYAKLRRSLAKI